MRNSGLRWHRARRAAILALALPLLALGLPSAAGAGGDPDVVWLKVELHDSASDRSHIKVTVPLSLIEVVVDSIDTRELMANIEEGHPSLDIQKMWKSVRDMKGEEFLTVESDKENVRVWKDVDFFRIDVMSEDRGGAEVKIQMPLEVMDYLFESKRGRFDFQEIVDRLRHHLPLTLVELHDDHHEVKVWLERQ